MPDDGNGVTKSIYCRYSLLSAGLLNGPMFRRFTFRQVAMAGALLIFLGIILTAFCETFIGYMISYALLFGKYTIAAMILPLEMVIWNSRT